ncbi:MAG: hypothetical protein JSR11_03590 [Bacteroidetes bacterium]|nr:hypothetical protein [Bacteroidota bacterium]
MPSIDFIQDDDLDLYEDDNGNLVEGFSDGQHIQTILSLEPAELKSELLVGVGIKKKINGVLDGNLRKEVTLQLQGDGFTINTMNITGNEIEINGNR